MKKLLLNLSEFFRRWGFRRLKMRDKEPLADAGVAAPVQDGNHVEVESPVKDEATVEEEMDEEVKEESVPLEPEAHEEVKDIHVDVSHFLFSNYEFRFNVLTDQVECRSLQGERKDFQQISKRLLNTMVIDARRQGVKCWDRDVERLLRSNYVDSFHPFLDYMDHLPQWDGVDRILPLALRVDEDPVWVDGFRRWLLALASQWMGITGRCANTLIPLLISPKQGMSKSTFCRLLMPPELRVYYLDKFDLNSRSNVETKLGLFGLINLDEFDRYSPAAMATLKNLVQLNQLTVKKAYSSYYLPLKRIASFIGTSNQTELLNDPSGSRRFLCVEVKHPIDCSALEYDQLYAQLKELVLNGERVWMNAEEEVALQEHNRSFKRLHPEEEVFFQLYRHPVEGEEGLRMTTTQIHQALCKCNPAAMRGITVVQLGKTLMGLGLQRIHTRVGSEYVVSRESAHGRGN